MGGMISFGKGKIKNGRFLWENPKFVQKMKLEFHWQKSRKTSSHLFNSFYGRAKKIAYKTSLFIKKTTARDRSLSPQILIVEQLVQGRREKLRREIL